jgi:hypothetical protein
MCTRLILVLTCIFFIFTLPLSAEDDEQSLFRLRVENDSFPVPKRSDQYYTNAVRMDFLSPTNRPPQSLKWVKKVLPDSRNADTTIGWYLAQTMYTPSDITLVNPPLTDRPYGGWLQVGVHGTGIRENGTVADSLDMSLGMVGPLAFAENTQKAWHHIVRARIPQGWHTQLPNEPAAEISYLRQYKLHPAPIRGWGSEFLPYGGGDIGTVFDQVHLGSTARVGYNIPNDFGTLPLMPTRKTTTNTSLPCYGGAVFATAEVRGVGRNAFLDGALFRSSQSIQKMSVVYDVVLGVSVTLFRNVSLTGQYVQRSKEFVGQPSKQHFGSVTIGVSH